MFFGAGLAAFLPLDDESGKLIAVDFGEHNEDVRKTAVGDEHLLAVEKVMLAVIAQLCRRFGGHRVRARAGFS